MCHVEAEDEEELVGDAEEEVEAAIRKFEGPSEEDGRDLYCNLRRAELVRRLLLLLVGGRQARGLLAAGAVVLRRGTTLP